MTTSGRAAGTEMMSVSHQTDLAEIAITNGAQNRCPWVTAVVARKSDGLANGSAS
jgi:hypothetical protein